MASKYYATLIRGILLLILCSSASLLAADWPNWRGPDYTGISEETGWNPKALDEPEITWKNQIGTGFSTMSVVNGKVYTMGNENKDTDVIYCFDAASGDELWRREYQEPLDPKYYDGGSSATPTLHDGKVYTLSKKGVAFCLDAETGQVIWKKALPFEPPKWGFSGSVLILDEMAIYNVGTAGLALNKMTGDVIWKSENEVSGYSTPVPYQQDGEQCICLFGKNTVMGIEVKTGALRWSYPWKTKYDVNAADPIIKGSEVFITSGYNHGCALLRLNGNSPELLWENKNMRSQMSGPVLIDGFLYGFDDNELVCLEWKTGEKKWAEGTPKKGSLSAAGDKLIVIGERGMLHIVKATPESYQEISSAQVLEHLCWSMPVLANGYIYVRDAKKNQPDNLVCIDVRKKKSGSASAINTSTDWPQWQGHNRDNISTEVGLLEEWPAGGPEMLWAVDCNTIGFGYSSPVIAAGKIYINGKIDDNGILTCLDMDGNQLWQSDYGPEWNRSFPSARCAPSIVNGNAYVISTTGQVGSFNAQTGAKNWLVNAYEQFEGQYPSWGYSESPLVLDGKVIFTAGGKKALIAAFDVKDGSVVWTTPPNGDKSAFCSPVSFEWAGKTLVLTMTANHIIAVDHANGNVMFSYPISNYVVDRMRGIHPNTPIAKDNKIFVTSGYDMGSIQLELSDDGMSVEKCWTNQEFDNHHGGVVLLDGKLYGANWQSNKQGNWMCVDWETGQTEYEHLWGNKGSLTYADGMLYCYEEASGAVALVRASPSGFDIVSEFTITLGEKQHWAHPVVCGKRLYIRHGDILMAYNISEE